MVDPMVPTPLFVPLSIPYKGIVCFPSAVYIDWLDIPFKSDRWSPSSAVNFRLSKSAIIPFVPPSIWMKAFWTDVIAAIVKISSPHLNS